jgi:hypothetical protein
VLLAFLRANNGPSSVFMIANGLSATFGWTRKRLSLARKALLANSHIVQIRYARPHHAALYKWGSGQTGQN